MDMRFVSASLCLLASALSVSAAADACGDVDVFWGSGATALPEAEGIARGWSWEKAQCGNTHPGAVLPFGWVSVCAYTGGYSSGYGRLGVSGGGTPPVKTARMEGFGFTHFHQSGAGWCWVFYNLFRFAPAAIGADTSKPSSITDEKGSPGYYAASLPDYGSSFELAARKYAACHRYGFPGGRGRLTVDTQAAGYLQPVFGGRSSYRESAKCLGIREIEGGWSGSIDAYGRELRFCLLVADGKVASSCVKDALIEIDFDGATAQTVIGFSLESDEEAHARAKEAAETGFERSRREADEAWRSLLGRIKAEFRDCATRSRFYSALYHSFVKPVDCGGRFTDFTTMWDMYRTQMPLVLSVAPAVARSIMESMLEDSKEFGFVPNFNTWKRPGTRSFSQAVALGAYSLADGFFRGVLSKSDYPRMKSAFERELKVDAGRFKSPSFLLDLSGACMAAAFVARECGDSGYAESMEEKSRAWTNAIDVTTGLLPADAAYYEGCCHNYSFRPLPGMERRVALAGGTAEFNGMLDAFFAVGCAAGTDKLARTRHRGRFEGFNNESDMDAPLSYLWCGRADRFSEICDAGRRYRFADGPGGLPGNNDSGGLSSWYVWSCLGLLPVSGTPCYALCSPAVESAEVAMPAGTLKIRVERESPDSIYPECFSFNGREFREPWLKVGDVAKGGELVFRLSVKPSGRSPLPQWY